VGTFITIPLLSMVPLVSIQLVSPASGDKRRRLVSPRQMPVSIQLVSPASGDNIMKTNKLTLLLFPFN